MEQRKFVMKKHCDREEKESKNSLQKDGIPMRFLE
jgi:hypothetical protein